MPFTFETSIGPENLIFRLGSRSNPSSWSTSAISLHFDTWTEQFVIGRLTRRPVSCDASATVKVSLGKIESGRGTAWATAPKPLIASVAPSSGTITSRRRRMAWNLLFGAGGSAPPGRRRYPQPRGLSRQVWRQMTDR